MFLHIVMNSFRYDTRVLKACGVSSEVALGELVLVAALGEPGLPIEEQINNQLTVWRPRLKSRSWPKSLFVNVFKYIEWLLKIVNRMRAERPTIIHAHSLPALPIGVAVKWMTGASLVYDAHELETEVIGAGATERRLSRWLEAFCIRRVDQAITVCDSIADWYVDAYSIDRPFVVRNIPAWTPEISTGSNILREMHHIPEGELIFLYQGKLSSGRGIERLLNVFAGLDSDKHLVLMGYGSLESQVREMASRSTSIHFQHAVQPDEVEFYTSSADVGLCLIEDTCLSYYFSLPNKLFEYLLSGLPTMVNDMPEQRAIVDKYRCGWIVPELENELASLIGSTDRESLQRKMRGVSLARQNFSWETEAELLKEVYSNAMLDRASVDHSGSTQQ